jgi:hypothetical protein
MDISHLKSKANKGLDTGMYNEELHNLLNYIQKLEHIVEESRQYLVAASDSSMSKNNSEALADEILAKIKRVQKNDL